MSEDAAAAALEAPPAAQGGQPRDGANRSRSRVKAQRRFARRQGLDTERVRLLRETDS